MYNFLANEWTTLANLQTDRYRHGCGLATKSDRTLEAIVVGGNGHNTVEILNLESLTWRWFEASIFNFFGNLLSLYWAIMMPLQTVWFDYFRYAASQLPTDLWSMASVPYWDSFLVLGGKCTNQCEPDVNSKDILQYDPDTETWTKRSEQMATGRYWFGAVLVGSDIVECA